MANLSPETQFDTTKSNVLEAVSSYFPIKGHKHELRMKDPVFRDNLSPDDIRKQKKARKFGQTWGVPLVATLQLVDTKTGEVVSEKKNAQLLRLPKITREFTYIVRGQGRSVLNQFRLKSGVYTKRRQNGLLASQFNLKEGVGFELNLDDKGDHILLSYPTGGGSKKNVNLYPVMKAMGVTDSDMEKELGSYVTNVLRSKGKKDNRNNPVQDLTKLYEAMHHKKAPEDASEILGGVRDMFNSTEMYGDTTEKTLGEPHTKVSGRALLLAAKRIYEVARGDGEPDNLEDLGFKEIWSVEDHLPEKISNSKREITRRIKNNLDRSTEVGRVINASTFNMPVQSFFTQDSRSHLGDQTNPLTMISDHTQTTLMGSGGIGTIHQLTPENAVIDKTHMGFLDPMNTPECFLYPENYQVFTERGWVTWRDLEESDKLACRIGGRLEFCTPYKLVYEHYDGPGYEMCGSRVSWQLTPNHRVYKRPMYGKVWGFSNAEDVHDKKLRISSSHLPYEGGDLSYSFSVPGTDLSFDKDLWFSFLGWYISEGSTNKGEVCISQTHEKNRRIISTMCDRMGLPTRASYGGFYIKHRGLADYCRSFGKSSDRYIPDYVFTAPPTLRLCFIESLLLGDGRLKRNSDDSGYAQVVLTTTSSKLAFGFERLGIMGGRAVTVCQYEDKREEHYKDMYEVRLLRSSEWNINPVANKKGSRPRSVYTKIENYSGNVACAEVPGGMLYVRRTDIPYQVGYWTGNSKKTGVVQHLPLGVVKSGRTLYTPVYNVAKKKMELIDPVKLHKPDHIIGTPDQYKWSKGSPIPMTPKVTAFIDGARRTVPSGKVKYILPASGAMMGAMSSIVPFTNTNNGARVMMADRQIAQAISLKHREKPLVQTGTGNHTRDGRTYEDIFGEFASHTSPVSGEVAEVHDDYIVVKDAKKKRHAIDIYNNYPLNDAKSGTHLHSTPTVKVGDKVKKGAILADSNFTKDGVLAMGVNLRTAYLPSGGENFEDGVVISESAAKKMTSNHMYRFTVELDSATTMDKKKFMTTFGPAVTKEQANKLDKRGVIQVGAKLGKGDTIMAVLRKAATNTSSEAFRKMKKVLFKPYDDKSRVWDRDAEGTVVDVVEKGRYMTVYVKADEPMKEGDKLTGRYGNKGIVVRVRPDEDMPRTKEGKHAEVLMSPTTVPTRINLGQLFETAVSKIGEKTGKRYVAEPFHGFSDRASDAMRELKSHGLSAKEELFDPKTGKSLGKIGFGPQYILKLKHQVDKKTAVRGRDAYDINDAPKRGGKSGAQKLDAYGTYSLLAHGAKDFLREKFTLTSTRNDKLWEAIENGTPIPPPRTSFAWKKFEGFLNGLGVNLQKRGHNMKLIPFTDAQISTMSSGEIKKPHLMLYGDKEEVGGLFDLGVTGGISGSKWSHFKLHEPIPNPMFMKSIMSLTGLNRKDFLDVSIGKKGFDKSGKVVPHEDARISGGRALLERLESINVPKKLSELEAGVRTTKNKKTRENMNKSIKFLRALNEENLPASVYMLNKVPVMPPKFRPIMSTDDNSPFRSSLNGLYKYVGITNNELKETSKDSMSTEEDKIELRRALLGQVWKLYGAEARPYASDRSIVPREDEDTQGILEMIAGRSPKEGFFQDRILAKRQDMSMRTTITVGSDLDIDEVGLPKKSALKLFTPFVKSELKKRGMARTAQDLIDSGDKRAYDALRSVLRRDNKDGSEDFHPVVLKRDPALHKFSTMGYKVKLVDGDAIRLHPLSCEGFNADFDGDTMAVYVPVTKGAIKDVKKMLPSHNLFSATHGGVMHVPSQDAVWGLYEMTRWGDETKKKFKDHNQVLSALRNGDVGVNDIVSVGKLRTTPGRVKVDSMLPSGMRGGRHLHDPKYQLSKGNMRKMLNKVARNYKSDYATTVQTFLNVGNRHAYDSGRTVSLDDLVTAKSVRDPVISQARIAERKINAMNISSKEKEQKIIDVYNQATDKMLSGVKRTMVKGNNSLFHMNQSGARGKDAQMRQMLLAPMMVQNAKSETHPVPITRSYSEGLDFGSFWDTQHGARKGIVQRASGTAEPGAMSKKIINTSMAMLVSNEDCGTRDGVLVKANSDNAMGRVLAKDVTVGSRTFKAGDIVDGRMRKNLLQNQREVPTLHLRSPMKCEQDDGLCSKCFGLNEEGALHELGVNVGVRAGQAVGEPLSQGAMNAFHSGGVARGAGAASVSMFQRVKQLIEFPEKVRGATTLARNSGNVQRVIKNPTGGYTVLIDGKEHKVQHKPSVRVGTSVKKGDPLSAGVKNPREMMEVFGPKNGIKRVRQYLNDEMSGLFGARSSLHKRNVETVVRSLTDLVEVTNPGNATDLTQGDFVSGATVAKKNKEGQGVEYNPILKGANVLPLYQTNDFLARANYEKLKNTFVDAANQGWKSSVHGSHPIPALAWGKEFGKGSSGKPWLY